MSSPAPQRSWSAETKRWWTDFWASERGQQLPPTLRPTVSRLFGWYHRRQLLERRVDKLFAPPRRTKAGMVDDIYSHGSTGQPKVNPLVEELRSIEDQIEALERRVFGEMSPAPAGGGSGDPAVVIAAINAWAVKAASSDESADPRLELLPGGRVETA